MALVSPFHSGASHTGLDHSAKGKISFFGQLLPDGILGSPLEVKSRFEPTPANIQNFQEIEHSSQLGLILRAQEHGNEILVNVIIGLKKR